ncbi:MAG: TM1812 family CRISPR-associated protein [candidate division WOR-3 bacterium]
MPTLLTFLGAIPYELTRYYFEGQRDTASEPTPYVQEAILQHLHQTNERVERVLVFATKDAQANNYTRCIERFDREKNSPVYSEQGSGLKKRLESLKQDGVIGDYSCTTIPNGNTEEEILRIFQILYEQVSALPEGSDIVFDLTYGFRSLPMLCMLLLHYARTLHSRRVSHVFYGNYEVGRHEKEERLRVLREQNASSTIIEEQKKTPPLSPVLELRVFADLQEWTIAAHTFVKSGDASLLARRMNEVGESIIGKSLQDFTDQILTCRGKDLSERDDIEGIKADVRNLQRKPDLGAPLAPLLERIEQKLLPFSNRTTRNGFAAVEWCIEHGLIQQGLTLLEEACKSYLIEQVYGIARIQDEHLRVCAKLALNRVPKSKWKPEQEADAHRMTEYLLQNYPEVSHAYRQLTGNRGLRNDVNHSGYMPSSRTPEELKEGLSRVYANIKAAFKL